MISFLSAATRPSDRAALARERIDDLKDDEVIFVDRLGPRILRVPQTPTIRLNRDTLRALDKGQLSNHLAQGTRISASALSKCQHVTVDTGGQYSVQKQSGSCDNKSPVFTIRTLNVWTGEPGEIQPDRNIDDLIFYSVSENFLPGYHSWKNDKFERRESSVGLENRRRALTARDQDKESGADLDDNVTSDSENEPRYNPKIDPSSIEWEGVEEYFKWIVREARNKKPNPRILEILDEEFEDSQKLLAIPATRGGYRAKIQDENTGKYHKALSTTFQSKPDNLVTKLTMLHFGLPIKPFTLANFNFLPAQDGEEEPGDDRIDRNQWKGKPLAFMNSYNGHPIIRMERNYQEIDPETEKDILAEANVRAKRICGLRSGGRSKQDLYLRGGAGSLLKLSPGRPVWLHTDMGRFLMDDNREAFVKLASKLLGLENVTFQCQIDLIPVEDIDAEVQNIIGGVQSYIWTSWERNNLDYDQIVTPKRANPRGFQLRVRHVSNGEDSFFKLQEGTDPWQPAAGDILLEMEDIGITYWRIPRGKFSELAVNEYHANFMEAIKCLLPNHKGCFVEWRLTKELAFYGQIYLNSEVPPVALYKAVAETFDLAKRTGDTGRITVHFKGPNEVNMELEDLVGIVIPGCNEVGCYKRFPEADYATENPNIFNSIREYMECKRPCRPIRLWPTMEHFTTGEMSESLILSPKKDSPADTEIWIRGNLSTTKSVVVVQPTATILIIIDARSVEDIGSSKADDGFWRPADGIFSLASFRDNLGRIFPESDPGNSTIYIEQSSTGHLFVIHPSMTEHQWKFQVFNWICPPDIYIKSIRSSLGTYKDEIHRHLKHSKTEWEKYHKMAGRHEQRHREAYTRDESVFVFRRRRNSVAENPTFGPSFEESISGGGGSPQLFTNMLNASDGVSERLLSRQRQKIIADKQDFCPICRTALEAGPDNQDAREQHFQGHRDAEGNASGSLGASASGSGHGQDQKYERLLSQAIGILQENGDSGCCFSGCPRRFSSTANKTDKADHFLEHIDRNDPQRKPCPISDCAQDLAELNTAEFQGHLANHLDLNEGTQNCPHKDCGFPLNMLTEDQRYDHLEAHALEHCHICIKELGNHSPKTVRAHYLKEHINSPPSSSEYSSTPEPWPANYAEAEQHIGRQVPHIEGTSPRPIDLGPGEPENDQALCPWPGCFQIFRAPSEEVVRGHMETHWANEAVPPEYHDAGTAAQSPPPTKTSAAGLPAIGISPLGPLAVSNSTSTERKSAADPIPDENQDSIPQRLRAAHPGMNFYCPTCLTLVSGKNASPCRRHRASNCGVQGHEAWLIMTATQMVQRKAQDKLEAGTGAGVNRGRGRERKRKRKPKI